jgi:hypothetical protein
VSDYIKNAPKQSTKPSFRRFITGEPKNNYSSISIFPEESTSGFLTTLRAEKKKKESHSSSLTAYDIAPYLLQIVIKTKIGSNHEYPRLVYRSKGGGLTEESVSKFPANDLNSIFNILFCARPKGIDHLKKIMSLSDVPTIGDLTTSDEVKKMRIAKLQVDITWYTKVYMEALKNERDTKKKDTTVTEEDLLGDYREEKQDQKITPKSKKTRQEPPQQQQHITPEEPQDVQWNTKKRKRRTEEGSHQGANATDPMSDNSGYILEAPESLDDLLGLIDIIRNPEFVTNPYLKANVTVEEEIIPNIPTACAKMIQHKKVSQTSEPDIFGSIFMYTLHYVVQEKRLSMYMARHILEQKGRTPISELENNAISAWKTLDCDVEARTLALVCSVAILMLFDQLYNPSNKTLQV